MTSRLLRWFTLFLLTFSFVPVASAAEPKVLTFGINPVVSTLDQVDKDNKFAGPNIDFIEAMAAAAGYSVKWTIFEGNEEEFMTLAGSSLDGFVSIGPGHQDSKLLRTHPYFDVDTRIYVSASGTVNLSAKGLVWGYVATGTPGENQKFYQAIEDAFKDLVSGEVPVISVNGLAARWLFDKQPDLEKQVKPASVKYTTDRLHWLAMTDKSAEIIAAFDAGLDQMVEEGKYADIFRKWAGSDVPNYYLEHMAMIDEIVDKYDRPLRGGMFYLLVNQDSSGMFKKIDEEIIPGIEKMKVPDSAGARILYQALQTWANAIHKALKNNEKGMSAANAVNPLTAAYTQALWSLINIP